MRVLPSRPDARAILAVLMTLASFVAASSAKSQIFVGVGARTVAMPGETAAAPVSAEPAPPRESMRFLPNTIEGLRLSGETGVVRWPVYLTAEQVAAPLRFRVGYVSAVSILPEVSSLEIAINDQPIGRDAIDAARGLRTVEFAVPAGLLKPGYNAIALSVRQRHRVDCSVAASYELWTRIDPSVTGLVLPAGLPPMASLADVPALLPRADGALPIHVILAGKTNAIHIRHLVLATQRVAIDARAMQPVVDFAPPSVDPFGVDLVLGTRAALRRMPRVADSLGATGPLARLLAGPVGGRPTLLVTGDDDREIDEAIAHIVPAEETPGSLRGLVALAAYPARIMDGGARIELRDLGLQDQGFAGRFFHEEFNLSLPADFMASDYGRGAIDLAGGYVAGLTRDAQVRVDVNGRNAGIIKLPSSSGASFTHNQLFLPLGLMRPGFNRVDVFAETARPEDATCAATDTERFRLSDASRITLPALAHVQRLPDLAVTTAGGLPFTHGSPHLVVPKPDRETMGAALSLTARAAVAAGDVIPFDFATKMPSDGSGSILIVSPARALDPATMRMIGLDPKAVETAWNRVPASKQNEPSPDKRWWLTRGDGPPACRLPGAEPIVAASMPTTGSPGEDLVETAGAGASPAPGWRDRLVVLSDAMGGWVSRSVGPMPWAKAAGGDGIDATASLILAQGMSAGSADQVTTIVTAPDARALSASLACLFDPQVWAKVHGRLAALDASSGDVVATDATRFRYVASDKNSLANSRLVIAGWFSLNPLAFVLLALLTALCLGGSTLWFVRGVGRRPE